MRVSQQSQKVRKVRKPSKATVRTELQTPTAAPWKVLADRTAEIARTECDNSVSTKEIATLLDSLVDGLAGGQGKTEIDPLLRTDLGQRLLAMLRSQMLREWGQAAEMPTAREMLSKLEAVERVQKEVEPSWPSDLEVPLTGPQGLDLVVELAHDFRSPLNAILLLAENLQRRGSGDVNELQHRQLGLIYSAALGISGMASDVIEMARGGSRLADDQAISFSVSDIMESIRDMVRPMAEEKALTIRLLRPTVDRRLGHPLALSRVLLNLTTNALKFTHEGLIEIMARETDDIRVQFSIRDTGPGINAAAEDTLYSPFRKVTGNRHFFSGTGLGLSLCRRLVRAMGSELEFESKAGWGTRFYFDLSLEPVSTVRAEPE